MCLDVFLGILAEVDDDPTLVGAKRFQSVELRPQQRGRHEMT